MKLTPKREILEAISRGDGAAVKSVLASAPELLHARSGSNSLLHLAASKGAIPIMNALVQAGLDINVPEAERADTPLHHAARNGQLDACQWLLNHGADVNAG